MAETQEVTLKAESVDFTVGQGDSQVFTWEFEDTVTAAEWVQTTTHDGTVVTWGLVQAGSTGLTATLTRTQAATIPAGNHRWRLRLVSGETQRTRGGRWTVL